MTMKVSYYPGCSLEETALAYDVSARRVCSHLGIELQEVPQWSCCGSSPALKMDHRLSTALGAHNLALVRQQTEAAEAFQTSLLRLSLGAGATAQVTSDIAKLGHGGYCAGCRECRYPACGFGKV